MGVLLSRGWGAPLLALVLGALAVVAGGALREVRPVRIGVLHALSGSMAETERPLVEMVQMAVEEINASGGVRGRRVEAVVVDAGVDEASARAGAERLLRREGVAAVFGCWTSTCRRAVRPLFEQERHLLFYPLQYEGAEASPNIVYLGATPNQQILPALRWALAEHGPRTFLVGSDYVFPRTAHEIIRNGLRAWRGTVVGEAYIPLGSAEVEEVVERIAAARPDVVLNTLNGRSNAALFRAMRARGLTPEVVPTLSFSLGEEEIRQIGPELLAGDHAAWSYFRSLEEPGNAAFVERVRARYGEERVTDDPMEAAYAAVHLWAAAVRSAGSTRPAAVRRAVRGLSIHAPGGMLYVDPRNLHVWKPARVGRIRADGGVEVVWSSRAPITPMPFPPFRSEESWLEFLDSLHRAWGGWSAPPPSPVEP